MYGRTEPTPRTRVNEMMEIQETPRTGVSLGYFESGHMAVTAEGMKQMGEYLFGDRKPVPDWHLTDVESTADLPAFIPSGYQTQTNCKLSRVWGCRTRGCCAEERA